MIGRLAGKRVAILATDGFEQEELISPRDALIEAGARVDVIAPKEGTIRAWNHKNWGVSVDVDHTVANVRTEDYDALVLPGGVINPDRLRLVPEAIAFIREFAQTGKPLAAICHGPWTLIDAEIVDDRRVTSWPSLRKDLENAGARWVDREVAIDRNLITSRKPDDLEAFQDALIDMLAPAQEARV